MLNPTGSSNTSGDSGMTAPLETRFFTPGGMIVHLLSASGMPRFLG